MNTRLSLESTQDERKDVDHMLSGYRVFSNWSIMASSGHSKVQRMLCSSHVWRHCKMDNLSSICLRLSYNSILLYMVFVFLQPSIALSRKPYSSANFASLYWLLF